MFRLIRFIFLIVVTLGICTGSYFYLTRVERLERYLSKKLETDVTIKDVRIGLKSVTVEGLKIQNLHSTVFKVDEIRVVAPLWNLFGEEIEISSVTLMSPTLGIMFLNKSGSENNWSEAVSTHSPATSKKFKIEELKIVNLHFEAVIPGGKSLSLPQLPYLELRNLHSRTLANLESEVLEKIAEREPKLAAFFGHMPVADNESTSATSLLKGGVDAVKKRTDEAVRYLKGLFS